MNISYAKWTGISLPIRIKVATHFGVARTRSTSVVNNVVVDDGYDVKALESALNIEAMQAFTGSKEKDPNVLLDEVINKIEAPVVEAPKVEVSPAVEVSNAKPEKIKIDDKPSKAKVEKILKAVPKKVKRPR